MRIVLKSVIPSPFRDMSRYPFQRSKIERLKASIRTTGFWENVLVRKSPSRAGCFEIAYGHHRLEALRELVQEQVIDDDFVLEVPCRDLDDATMLRILASENAAEYAAGVEVLDETVRASREYIQRETKTPLNEITAADISQFLGGGWYEDKVAQSLQRLGLFDRGVMKAEQVVGMTSNSARSVMREVARVEKAVARGELEKRDGDFTEDERKGIRTKARNAAAHIAGVLSDHVRSGGSVAMIKEKSLDAQAESIAPDAPDDERKLSTIDAAARAVTARDFQRKVEMLCKYKTFMSPGAKHELQGTLAEVYAWAKNIEQRLNE